MQMDGLSMGSNNNDIVARQQKKLLIQPEPSQLFQRVTIGSLPDNVLLDIFDFYQAIFKKELVTEYSWNWETLVHVCRRWRYIIFESPIRLNLELICTENSPVKGLLDVWPPFPLIIRFKLDYWRIFIATHNLIAALERRDRVREIHLNFVTPDHYLPERIVMAMTGSFPALRYFSFKADIPPVDLETLLNGSAPCLRHLTLSRISFPSLPQLLSSTSDLTFLDLSNISIYRYIVPAETMATSLSALPKLKCLIIDFESQTFRSNRAPPVQSLQTRFVLPALTRLKFRGESEYLEVLMARFDAPLLDEFQLSFFDQLILDIPQTVRFFGRYLDSFNAYSLTLTFKSFLDCAFISFPSNTTHHSAFSPINSWQIMCKDSNRRINYVAQICGQIPPFRSSVKSLIIKSDCLIHMEDPTLWLQLFHSFPSVQTLQIPVILEPSIASALETLTDGSPGAAEVFPSLHSISIVGIKLRETVQKSIQSFVAVRQSSGCPITVSRIRNSD
ncbi:hypothetical protein BGW80DRAFT_1460770 [Lactifluus volemus]|nr:hypothetical protein BGW80DRAFT_1460770 [Lactifluus volemus]